MKFLDQNEMTRIKLQDFVLLAKKYPSVLFLPMFGLMEQIFSVVEIKERDGGKRK